MATLVPGERSSALPWALAAGVSVGAVLLIRHGILHRDTAQSISLEPYLQWIHPSQYHANNPPWLVRAVEKASRDPNPARSSSTNAGPGSLSILAVPPPVRKEVQRLQHLSEDEKLALMGEDARNSLFMLEEGTTYLNHGSYGAALRLAIQAQRYFQDRLEEQPVRFMETEAMTALQQAQRALADLVKARPADLVLVPNATTAVNAVLHSVLLRPGDLILIASTTYPAVRSAAARVAAQRGAGLLEVGLLDVLGQPAQILQRHEAALRAGRGRVRLAIIDQIVSLAPVHLPVQQLCTLCAAHGAASLVDGAHAVGAVHLDIPALGCDYYTSNAHKWLCAPKGVAFLWARQGKQEGLLPLVTSHGYGLGFQGEFMWQGTSDLTACLALPTAVAAMQALEPAASQYRTHLLLSAVQLLRERWGTQAALGVQAEQACMCAVELPPFRDQQPSAELAASVHATLRNKHSIEVPVAYAAGRMWCRISAQIYNETGDYAKLAAAVQELAAGGTTALGEAGPTGLA